jgi:hypothetical protein
MSSHDVINCLRYASGLGVSTKIWRGLVCGELVKALGFDCHELKVGARCERPNESDRRMAGRIPETGIEAGGIEAGTWGLLWISATSRRCATRTHVSPLGPATTWIA